MAEGNADRNQRQRVSSVRLDFVATLGIDIRTGPRFPHLVAKRPSRKARLRGDLALVRTVTAFFLSTRSASLPLSDAPKFSIS
jgi:hypothetical protein